MLCVPALWLPAHRMADKTPLLSKGKDGAGYGARAHAKLRRRPAALACRRLLAFCRRRAAWAHRRGRLVAPPRVGDWAWRGGTLS